MNTIIWITAPLIIAAVGTLAATIRHRRQPRAVIGHCRKMVEHAESCYTQQDPERTQEAFRLVIEKLRQVRSAFAEPGGGKSDSDRIIAYLMRPETTRLWHQIKDILSRAEAGLGLSLLSQRTAVQKAAIALSGRAARRLTLSLAAVRVPDQFLAHLQDEAIQHLEAAVALAPTKAEYLYALARAYESAGRNKESLAVIQSAISMDPGVDNYYRLLTDVAWKMGAYELYNQGLLGMVETSGHGRGGGRSSCSV